LDKFSKIGIDIGYYLDTSALLSLAMPATGMLCFYPGTGIVTCDEVLATSADVLGMPCRFVADRGIKIRRWLKILTSAFLLNEII
jgi:hypothetical protein